MWWNARLSIFVQTGYLFQNIALNCYGVLLGLGDTG